METGQNQIIKKVFRVLGKSRSSFKAFFDYALWNLKDSPSESHFNPFTFLYVLISLGTSDSCYMWIWFPFIPICFVGLRSRFLNDSRKPLTFFRSHSRCHISLERIRNFSIEPAFVFWFENGSWERGFFFSNRTLLLILLKFFKNYTREG